MKDRTKIAYFGIFGKGNFGNDCTLQAILSHTRRYLPDAAFICISSNPETAALQHNMPASPISWRYLRKASQTAWLRSSNVFVKVLRKLLRGVFITLPAEFLDWVRIFRTLKSVHTLIVPGTGFLTDATTDSPAWPYEIFKWSLVARLLRCNLLFVSVGAGPIYRTLSRWLIRSALSLADYRSYRDTSTLTLLEHIGVPIRSDSVYPDLAFSLDEAVIPPRSIPVRRRRVVGIGLMSYAGRVGAKNPNPAVYSDYIKTLVTLARWLLARDYDVRVLVGDTTYDTTARIDFRHSFPEHTSACNEGRFVDNPPGSFEELLSQLAVTDFVVATRFHNVLLALLLNKPAIAITFHHKGECLMNEMGLRQYRQNINDLDSNRLIQQFLDLEKNEMKLKCSIRQKTEECRKALDHQYAAIFRGYS